MRNALAVAAFSFFAIASSLEAAKPTITRLPDGEGARLIQRRAEMIRQDRATNAIFIDASTSDFIIPSAGSLEGGGGTFFRSDITIINHENAEREIAIVWLARNSTVGIDAPTFQLTMPRGPLTIVTFHDMVGQELGLTGLGALWFTGVDEFGEPDFSANIDGFSRIWTPQPNSTGTVSQQFPAATVVNLLTETDVYALGLRQDANFRSNIGIVNLESIPLDFQVVLIGDGVNIARDVTVPAFGMVHSAAPAGNHGDFMVIFIPPSDDFIFWTAYATSNDNLTGDGWVALPSFLEAPEGEGLLGAGRSRR